MNFKLSVLTACTVVCAWACGPTTYDQQQTQVAITPKGSVVGRVTELATGAPLEGVTVTVIGPTRATATTDATGSYVVGDVTVSSASTILFEKMGYLRSIGSATIPSAAGNAPLSGGYTTVNPQMAKAIGEVRGLLVLPDGTPASGAQVTIDQRSQGYDSVVTSTTDMQGNFTLSGLAASPYGQYFDIVASWYDANNDGVADYGASRSNTYVYPGVSSRVFMTYSDVGQRVLTSNVLDGDLGTDEAITFTFALPAKPLNAYGSGTDQFSLYDANTGDNVAVSVTWASPTQVSVKPEGTLLGGRQYRLNINALQSVGGGDFSATYTFQIRGADATGPTASVTNLTVTGPNTDPTKFDYNTSTFTVSFNPVAGIYDYWVYAKDSTLNQGFVRIFTINTSNSSLGRVTRTFGLPGSFNGGYPLLAGNTMTVVVVPVDQYGTSGPITGAPTAVVKDNIAPTTGSASAVGVIDAFNETALATTVTIRLTYSEPMSTDPVNAPVLTSASGAVTQAFVFDATATSGLLALTLPSGANGDRTGTFVIRGGKDQAGNSVSGPDFTGSLGGRKELVVNGGFEDAAGACTLMGWSQVQTGGMPATTPVAGAGVPSSGRCAALVGAPLSTAPQTGTSKLTQDVTLPAIAMTPWHFELSYRYRPEYFAPNGVNAAVTQRCQLTDTSDVALASYFNVFSQTASNYNAVPLVNFAPPTDAMTVRINCLVDNSVMNAAAVNAAIYLDAFSIAQVRPTAFNQ